MIAMSTTFEYIYDNGGTFLQHKKWEFGDEVHGARLDYIEAKMKEYAEYGIPAGAVDLFDLDAAPFGWLECNAAAVSRTTYARLFEAIGTRHGTGDGSTTFNLPDFRGEFIRGLDSGRGVDTGRTIGSAQAENVGGHNHQYGRNYFRIQGTGGYTDFRYDAALPSETTLTMTATGEAVPRNVAFMICIKY